MFVTMQNSLLQNQYVRGLIVLALIGLVGALGAYTYFTFKQAKGAYTGAVTITATGEGEVFAKPDIGSFTFMVQTEGVDATEAQNKNAAAMEQITKYLTGAGVAEADIKTDGYQLSPKYRYENTPCVFNSYCPPSEPIQDGFEVFQNVTVKVRDLATAGNLISGVGDQGATNISSLQFTIDDESALKDDARLKAIEDARTKGEAIAASLGMKIVKVVGFYEEGDGGMPMPYAKVEMMGAMDSAAPARDAVLPTGENTITSRVSVTYELK